VFCTRPSIAVWFAEVRWGGCANISEKGEKEHLKKKKKKKKD
jgi:hypothetical protein